MAEGGYDFDNPTYDPDEGDETEKLLDNMPDIPKSEQSLADLREEVNKDKDKKRVIVERFYNFISKTIRLEMSGKPNMDQFRLESNGSVLHWLVDGKDITMTTSKGGFYL